MMELILDLLTHPESSLKKIRDDDSSLKKSFWISGSASLSVLISILLLAKAQMTSGEILQIFILFYAFILLMLFLKNMALHTSAWILGGEGKLSALFAMLNYSFVPLHFILPLTLLLDPFPLWINLLGWFYLVFWTARLGVQSIQINYQLSRLKILAVILTPLGTLFFLSFVALFFFVLIALIAFLVPV